MPEMPAGAGERLWLQRERVELEALFHQVRIVEMPASDKGRRMPAPLPRPPQPGSVPSAQAGETRALVAAPAAAAAVARKRRRESSCFVPLILGSSFLAPNCMLAGFTRQYPHRDGRVKEQNAGLSLNWGRGRRPPVRVVASKLEYRDNNDNVTMLH